MCRVGLHAWTLFVCLFDLVANVCVFVLLCVCVWKI